jgi:serine/threonine protein kinase
MPAGARISEFEILQVLGSGGFGIVYLAHDTSLQRRVALKEYLPAALAGRRPDGQIAVRSELFADTFSAGLRSFINESRLLAKFDHPSLVKVHRFWEANGTAYMVMPFYEGVTLKQVRQSMTAPPEEAWLRRILDALLGALEVMHAASVFHRDIAPDNILLLRSGVPVLLDFGAARHVVAEQTQTITAMLKPAYAPIEQYADALEYRQGPWTDIYATAATLHYCLTGKAPLTAIARTVNETYEPLHQRAELRDPPQGQPYDAQWLAALDWGLEVKPQARPKSVAQWKDALSGRIPVPLTVTATSPIVSTAARTGAMPEYYATALTPQDYFPTTVAAALRRIPAANAPSPSPGGAHSLFAGIPDRLALTPAAPLVHRTSTRPDERAHELSFATQEAGEAVVPEVAAEEPQAAAQGALAKASAQLVVLPTQPVHAPASVAAGAADPGDATPDVAAARRAPLWQSAVAQARDGLAVAATQARGGLGVAVTQARNGLGVAATQARERLATTVTQAGGWLSVAATRARDSLTVAATRARDGATRAGDGLSAAAAQARPRLALAAARVPQWKAMLAARLDAGSMSEWKVAVVRRWDHGSGAHWPARVGPAALAAASRARDLASLAWKQAARQRAPAAALHRLRWATAAVCGVAVAGAAILAFSTRSPASFDLPVVTAEAAPSAATPFGRRDPRESQPRAAVAAPGTRAAVDVGLPPLPPQGLPDEHQLPAPDAVADTLEGEASQQRAGPSESSGAAAPPRLPAGQEAQPVAGQTQPVRGTETAGTARVASDEASMSRTAVGIPARDASVPGAAAVPGPASMGGASARRPTDETTVATRTVRPSAVAPEGSPSGQAPRPQGAMPAGAVEPGSGVSGSGTVPASAAPPRPSAGGRSGSAARAGSRPSGEARSAGSDEARATPSRSKVAAAPAASPSTARKGGPTAPQAAAVKRPASAGAGSKQRATVQRPAPGVASAKDTPRAALAVNSPREVCQDRILLGWFSCMRNACESKRWSRHGQCVEWHRMEQERVQR